MAARSLIPGAFLSLVGFVSLSIITLADWHSGSVEFGVGWQQIVGSLPSLLSILAGIVVVRETQRNKRPSKIRIIFLIGMLFGVAAILLVLIAIEPGRKFPYDATTGPIAVYEKVIKVAGISGTSVCRCAPTRRASIILPGGFRSHVSIYDRGGESSRIGLVIAHGNVWMGDNLATYRVIASGLAERGFVVATFDFPGFGEADSPYLNGPAAVADAADRVLQLNAVVEYMIASTDVEPNNIAIFGHSGGAEWAKRTATANPRIAKVAIMVAPPPPTFEGVSVNDGSEYLSRRRRYFERRSAQQHRFIYGKEVPTWSTWELTERNTRFPGDPWEPYKATGHKSILLILGERDQPGGHPEVLREFDSIEEPKQFSLIRESDHYANAAQTLGFVVYDTKVRRQLLDALSDWLTPRL